MSVETINPKYDRPAWIYIYAFCRKDGVYIFDRSMPTSCEAYAKKRVEGAAPSARLRRRLPRRSHDPKGVLLMMTGIENASAPAACPYPGGAPRTFDRSEVMALGKLRAWGDACIRFVVRLADGTLIFVRANEQEREDERWLRKLAKNVAWSGLVTREAGWRVDWAKIAFRSRCGRCGDAKPLTNEGPYKNMLCVNCAVAKAHEETTS